MRLITGVHVSGFRSIEDAALDDVATFNVLVGRNNSGKSNILRALNLFFSNQPEPGRALNFGSDHHTNPKRKKKKEIVVDVSFDIGEFKLRDDIRQLIRSGLGTRFTLRKKWNLTRQLEPELRVQVKRSGEPDFSDAPDDAVRSLIGLVNFRYIPNRTVPTDTLAARRPEVARAISKRVERTETLAVQDLLEKFRDAASGTLRVVDDELSAVTEGISQIEPAISESISDLISLSNFRALTPLGTSVADDVWGSGAQAYLMFSVLHAVDRDRSGYFGWRQGTIWAVEEPESSLHHDLAVALSERFHNWSNRAEDRLQIICTTHSEVFTMCSDNGYEVRLNEGLTQIKATPIPLLASNAARSGVTAWPQPLLAFPFSPLVFVEGGIDSRVLTHASKITGVAASCIFLSPSQLDPAAADGADNLAAYLQKFGNLWQRRPPESPVIVLFDWDRRPNDPAVARARRVFGGQADQRVLILDAARADARMTEQWTGIERFYSPKFIESADTKGVVSAARDSDARWLITKSALRQAKSPLADMLCASTTPARFRYLRPVLEQIERHVAVLTADYYQTVLPLHD